MDAPDDDILAPVPRAPRPWAAILLGASTGLLFAALAIAGWSWWDSRPSADLPPRGVASAVDVFRLPSGRAHEALLVPAGPDAIGEPRLSAALFPGETPPRELASFVLANVSPRDEWQVDLARRPVRGRVEGGAWEEFGVLDGVAERAGDADAVRLRALGGGLTELSLRPGSIRRVLLALPKNRKLSDLRDVEWDGSPLERDRLPAERLRRFREDPVAAMAGR